MPTSLTDSEIVLLGTLWRLSQIFAAAALFIFLVLVVRRVFQHRLAAQHQLRKKELSRMLHGFLDAPIDMHEPVFPDLPKSDHALVGDIALDMLRVLRGNDEVKLIALLNSWRMAAYLRTAMRKGRRGQRVRALTLLARLEGKMCLNVLFACARDRDPYVQMAALRGIAAQKTPEYLPEVVRCLIDSPNLKNTLMLTDVLRGFGEPAVPQLLVLAKSEAAIEVRAAAIRALGAIGSQDAVRTLIDLAQHGENDIRAQALVTLGKLGDRRAQPIVIVSLDSADEQVRLSAAQVAGVLHLQQAIPKLMEMSDDPVWWVRYRAADALYQMGPSGIDVLRSMTRAQNERGLLARQVLAEKEGLAA